MAETVREDVWVPSVCRMCGNSCGVEVHRVNGVVVKIEGHPDNPHNYGRICAKGLSNAIGIYNPDLPKTPLAQVNTRLDSALGLKRPYSLDASRRYTVPEVLDLYMKTMFDDEHSLEWFKENSFVTFPRTLEQMFPRGTPSGKTRLPRVPVYFEFLIDTGRQLDSVARELGLDLDTSGFQPGHFVLRSGHYQLAQTPLGDAVGFAKLVQKTTAFHT